MSIGIVGPLLGFFGLISGGLVTWLVAVRSTSGSVKTSSAEILWQQNQQLLKERADEIVSLRTDVAGLKLEVVGCRQEMATLQTTLTDRTEQGDQLQEDLRLLRAENAALRLANQTPPTP